VCGVIQRGGEMFPKDDNGQLIYDDIHFIETWKVRTDPVNTMDRGVS